MASSFRTQKANSPTAHRPGNPAHRCSAHKMAPTRRMSGTWRIKYWKDQRRRRLFNRITCELHALCDEMFSLIVRRVWTPLKGRDRNTTMDASAKLGVAGVLGKSQGPAE